MYMKPLLGADMGAMAEAEHYVKEVATGRASVPSDFLLPFLVHACEKVLPGND